MHNTSKDLLSFYPECLHNEYFYLYETLDEDFFELSEEDQHSHLEYYAWCPFEGYDGYKISNYIDDLATHIIDKHYPEKNEY